MVAWLLSADDEVDEIDVDLNGALILPDDQSVRLIGLVNDLLRLVDDDPS